VKTRSTPEKATVLGFRPAYNAGTGPLSGPVATRITNGCYRLHAVEWNIGEPAGALAAFALARQVPPRQVRNDRKLLADFQRRLEADGVELHWPRLTPR
jgi:hypothetical protein